MVSGFAVKKMVLWKMTAKVPDKFSDCMLRLDTSIILAEKITLLQKFTAKTTGLFHRSSGIDEEITPVRKLIKKMPGKFSI